MRSQLDLSHQVVSSDMRRDFCNNSRIIADSIEIVDKTTVLNRVDAYNACECITYFSAMNEQTAMEVSLL